MHPNDLKRVKSRIEPFVELRETDGKKGEGLIIYHNFLLETGFWPNRKYAIKVIVNGKDYWIPLKKDKNYSYAIHMLKQGLKILAVGAFFLLLMLVTER